MIGPIYSCLIIKEVTIPKKTNSTRENAYNLVTIKTPT